MDIFTGDASKLSDRQTGLFAVGLSYPKDVLAIIRSRRPLPQDFHRNAAGHILQLTRATMKSLFPGDEPSVEEASYSYPFRYNVAMYCMNLFWTATGNVTAAPPKKVRNDAMDMTYVAYASFFDGVITEDSKLSAAYDLTVDFLTRVFNLR